MWLRRTGLACQSIYCQEFYGPFGNFDVTIKMPSEYIIAGTGVLQNPEDIGYGYSSEEPKRGTKTGMAL